MPVTQESIIINDWENLAITERKRTTSTGTKSRFTIDIRAEPMAIRVDPEVLGRDVANAIGDAVRAGIQAIAAPVKTSTALFRKYANNAFHRGEGWAMRRYAGGKTPAAPPGSVSYGRLFNDSGRLARGVFARANSEEQGYTINVTANRLDRDSFGPRFEQMLVRLRDLVPALRAPETELHKDQGVRNAILKTKASLIQKGDRARLEAIRKGAAIVTQGAELVGRTRNETPEGEKE